MTTWPGTIPNEFEREGYQEGFANNVIKSNVDSGPPKRRRRTSANIKTLQGRIQMTTAETELLETFFYDTVGEANEFDFTHPRKETTISVVFSEPPTLVQIGPDLWSVSIKLEVQP